MSARNELTAGAGLRPLAPRHWAWGLCACLIALSCACERTGPDSAARALEQAKALVEVARADVAEVRRGLPHGAEEIAARLRGGADALSDPEVARRLLEQAQNKVQDLRVAKSTFFALATLDGVVVRNDREQDSMAGKALFPAFPALAQAQDAYLETIGSMPEAHGVKGKADGEWLAATPVMVDGRPRALYVTGWAWSSYAYRLEFYLRGKAKDEAKKSGGKVPLLYTFVVVGSDVYSAPESPEVNERAIAEKKPLDHLDASGSYSGLMEITGRTFAFGAQAATDLGQRIAIGVLRSEI